MSGRAIDTKNMFFLPTDVTIPKIPRTFLKNFLISQVLYTTIDGFNFEEQNVIFLYCFVSLPISEIAALAELSEVHVVSILTLYSERLRFKLDIFKKSVPYDTADVVSVRDMLDEAKRFNGRGKKKNLYAVKSKLRWQSRD